MHMSYGLSQLILILTTKNYLKLILILVKILEVLLLGFIVQIKKIFIWKIKI